MWQAIGAIGGAVVGGMFDRSNAAKARSESRKDILAKGERIRKSAERGGFNPLTMLGATGGVGFTPTSGVPPLSSIETFANIGSQLGSLADQRQAEEEKKDAAAERVREINSAPGGAEVVQRSSRPGGPIDRVTVNGEPVVNDARHSAMTFGPMRYPNLMNDSNTEFRLDPDKTNEYIGPLRQTVMVNGRMVSIPVGPDIDEIASGVALEVGDSVANSPTGSLLRRGFNEVVEAMPLNLSAAARLENALEPGQPNEIPDGDDRSLTIRELMGFSEPRTDQHYRNAPRYQ